MDADEHGSDSLEAWLFILGFVEDDSFPFEFATLEVKDEADRLACDFQIVEHLAEFVFRDAVDDFRVHDHIVENDEIGNILADPHGLVKNIVSGLLGPRNSA